MRGWGFPVFCILLLSFSSCVTLKKYHALDAAFLKSQADIKTCGDTLLYAQAGKEHLLASINELNSQASDLKVKVEQANRNSSSVLSAMHDLTATSDEQAKSVKQSAETLDKKNAYIQGMQSFIEQKDSMNLQLTEVLKDTLNSKSNNAITIKAENNKVSIDLPDTLLFTKGNFTISEKGKTTLAQIAHVLNAYDAFNIVVESYTDSLQAQQNCIQDNWDLSGLRAASVVRNLQNQYNIRPERMEASGKSDGIVNRTMIIILPQLDELFDLFSKR